MDLGVMLIQVEGFTCQPDFLVCHTVRKRLACVNPYRLRGLAPGMGLWEVALHDVLNYQRKKPLLPYMPHVRAL